MRASLKGVGPGRGGGCGRSHFCPEAGPQGHPQAPMPKGRWAPRLRLLQEVCPWDLGRLGAQAEVAGCGAPGEADSFWARGLLREAAGLARLGPGAVCAPACPQRVNRTCCAVTVSGPGRTERRPSTWEGAPADRQPPAESQARPGLAAALPGTPCRKGSEDQELDRPRLVARGTAMALLGLRGGSGHVATCPHCLTCPHQGPRSVLGLQAWQGLEAGRRQGVWRREVAWCRCSESAGTAPRPSGTCVFCGSFWASGKTLLGSSKPGRSRTGGGERRETAPLGYTSSPASGPRVSSDHSWELLHGPGQALGLRGLHADGRPDLCCREHRTGRSRGEGVTLRVTSAGSGSPLISVTP